MVEFIAHLLAVGVKHFKRHGFRHGACSEAFIHPEVEHLGKRVFFWLKYHQCITVLLNHAADLAVRIAHITNNPRTSNTAFNTRGQ